MPNAIQAPKWAALNWAWLAPTAWPLGICATCRVFFVLIKATVLSSKSLRALYPTLHERILSEALIYSLFLRLLSLLIELLTGIPKKSESHFPMPLLALKQAIKEILPDLSHSSLMGNMWGWKGSKHNSSTQPSMLPEELETGAQNKEHPSALCLPWPSADCPWGTRRHQRNPEQKMGGEWWCGK